MLPTKWSVRNLSSTPNTDVSYDQLKQALAGRTAAVIDVREPWELREYGTIPGSINVPRECIYLSNQFMLLLFLHSSCFGVGRLFLGMWVT